MSIIPYLNSYLLNVDQNLGIGQSPSLTTANLTESGNLFYTDVRVSANASVVANTAKITYPAADSAKVGFLSVTQAVNLDTMESSIALNDTHRSSSGVDHANVVLNDTHRASNGSDHGYIDQSVVVAANPQFGGLGIGIAGASGLLLVGAGASTTDFPNAKAVISQVNTGFASGSSLVGLVVETGSDSINTAYGILSYGMSNGTKSGIGILGVGLAGNTADTNKVYGGQFVSDTVHAGGSNTAIYASATNGATNHSFYGVAGDIYNNGNLEVTGDIYTTPWTDYSGTSSFTGWSSFTTKILSYKKIGKTVFISFVLSGPSAAGGVARCTTPFTARADADVYGSIGYTMDNSIEEIGASVRLTKGTTTIDFMRYPDAAWSVTGTKTVRGQFWYETA